MRVRTKICGIGCAADLSGGVSGGADAVDFIVATTHDRADAVLLDSRTTTRLGGTGLTHDWGIGRRIVRALGDIGRPVILAGGLDPTNVAEAVRVVRPFGVDANSRLKNAQGRKDATACAAFVSAARITE